MNVTETIERLVSESLNKSLGNLDAQLEHLIQDKVEKMMTNKLTTFSSSNATHGVTEQITTTSSNATHGVAEQLPTGNGSQMVDHGPSEHTNRQQADSNGAQGAPQSKQHRHRSTEKSRSHSRHSRSGSHSRHSSSHSRSRSRSRSCSRSRSHSSSHRSSRTSTALPQSYVPDDGNKCKDDDVLSITVSDTPTKAFNAIFAGSTSKSKSAQGNKENVDPLLDKDEMVKEKDQEYWDCLAAQYAPETEFGPELPSSVACAAKLCWSSSLDTEKIKKVQEKGKPPLNCKFLKVKPCNKVVFTTIPTSARTQDCTLQRILTSHSAMSSLLLQATAKLRDTLKGTEASEIAETLKECIILAGDTQQQLSKARKDNFRSFLPQHLKKLCEEDAEDSEFLFGDDLQQKLKEIKAENELKTEFSKKVTNNNSYEKGNKGRYHPYERKEETSSNSKASPKSRGSYNNSGQRYNKNKNDHQDSKTYKGGRNNNGDSHQNGNRYNNNNNNNNKSDKNQKYKKRNKK